MKFKIKKDLESTLNEVKEKIEIEGGTFNWDTKNWEFFIKWVKWEYYIEKDEIEINIIKKPFLISLSFIEKKLAEYFN